MEKRFRNRREVIEAASILLLALTVAFGPTICSGRTFLPTDLTFDLDPLWWSLAPDGYSRPSNQLLTDQVYLYFSWGAFVRRFLAQVRIPLWNPYVHSGLPFVGNYQSAIFSPFHLVGYLFPFHVSYIVMPILQLSVAGLFTFLFARENGLSKMGSLLAMLTFTFSGPMIVWLGYPLSPVVAWLPAMLFTIERALVRKSNLYVMACSIIVGLQFLGGHPETTFHVMLAWGAYALYRAISLVGWRPTRLLPHLARIATAGSLGALLAAIQLAPFAEAVWDSAVLSMKSSSGTLSVSRLLFEWQEWPAVLLLLLPHYFGTPLDNSYWYPYSNYVELNAYAGILPLVLAVVVVCRHLRPDHSPHRSLVIFFTLMAVISLGVAMHLPLLNAVNFLSLFSLAANGRLRLIYVFAVAILAGIGLDRIGHQDAPTERWLRRALVSVTLLSLLLITATYLGFVLFRDQVILSGRAFIESRWGSDPYLNRPLEYYYALVDERYEKKLALYRPTHIAMYVPVLVTLVWVVLPRFGKRARRAVLPWAAVVLTFLDLFIVGKSFNPTVAPEEMLPTPGAIRFLQQDQSIYRVCGTGLILYPNIGMVWSLPDVRGYDTVVPNRYMALVNRIEGHYQYHFHSLFIRADAPLLDLLNVKYLLTDQEPGEKWELVYEGEGTVRVYRNRNVLPRAFVVYQAEIVENSDKSLERLLDEQFNFRERVILEQPPLNWSEPEQAPATTPEVRFRVYEPNRVILDVRTEADGLLVLTDNYAPGWQAFLDTKPVPIYIADHAFRAVVVPAGQHRVEFAYRPWSFYAGATLSLLTALILFTGLIWCIRKKSGQ